MKTKSTIALLWLILSASAPTTCCSCGPIFFCDYIKETTVGVAFQAVVFEKKDYGADNLAIYLKVIKKYKDEVALTDTIKLYGNSDNADCDLEVHRLQIGDTIIAAIDTMYDSPFFNPDSLTENYSGFRPNICAFIVLGVKVAMVKGWISEGVPDYPLATFEAGLEGCDFPVEEIIQVPCAENKFNISPNPAFLQKVRIKSENQFDVLKAVRVYSMDGRLIERYFDIPGDREKEIDLADFSSGVFIFELECEGRKEYHKVVVVR